MGKIKNLIVIFLIILSVTGCKNVSKKNKNKTTEAKKQKPIVVDSKVLKSVNDGYIDTPVTSKISAINADPKTKTYAYMVIQSEDAPDKKHPYPDVDISHKIYISNKNKFFIDADSALDSGNLKYFSNNTSFAYNAEDGISIINKKNKKHILENGYFSWNPKDNNEVAILQSEGGDENHTDYIFSLLILNIKNNKRKYLFKKVLRDINEVVFAPNGKDLFYAIAYSLPGAKNRYELRKINIKDKSSKLLNSRMNDPFFTLSVSPNGKWLTFKNVNDNLQLMNIDSKKISTFKNIKLETSSSWLSNNELLINNFNEIDKVKFKFVHE